MGSLQAEELVLGKEDVGPLLMVVTACNAPRPALSAQQTSQSSTYPTVEVAECPAVAVLVVSEPAAQDGVEVGDHVLQPAAGVAVAVTIFVLT